MSRKEMLKSSEDKLFKALNVTIPSSSLALYVS
jgi:hypothetical protein